MRNPDFFVVGAAKSGTTALWNYFKEHPQIYVCPDKRYKELGYYSKDYGLVNKKQYLNHFKDAQRHQMIGEVCHSYLSSPESASWIKSELPKSKIIIILRNPIHRAYSLYNWMIMHGFESNISFEKVIERENDILKGLHHKSLITQAYYRNYLYFHSGLYFNQVKRYIENFDLDQILIIKYEDFKRNQVHKLNEIYHFLGLNQYTHSENANSINVSKSVLSPRIQTFCRKAKKKYRIKNSLITKLSATIMNINTLNVPPKTMDAHIYNVLKDKYELDIRKLSELTQINFFDEWMTNELYK